MEMFDLNASGKLKKMSKGMKQKIGIVCAFMNKMQVYWYSMNRQADWIH